MTAFITDASASKRPLLVALHTTSDPSDDEWNHWCDLCEIAFHQVKGDLAQMPNLVLTDGGLPSMAQRTRVAQLLADGHSLPRVAVVSDSIAVRSAVRAFGAFNPDTRSFSPTAIADAFAHCGFTRSDTTAIVEAIEHRVERTFGRAAPRWISELRAHARAR